MNAAARSGGGKRAPAHTHRVAMRMVAPLLEAARQAGVQPGWLLARAGLSHELAGRGGTDEHIAFGQYLALWQLAAAESRRRDLPLRAAAAEGTESFGAIGFSCMTSPTVAGAFAHLARYYGVLSTAARWWLVEERGRRGAGRRSARADQRLRLEYELQPLPGAATETGRALAIEFALAEVVHFARLFAAAPLEIVEVLLPHAAPEEGAAAHEAHFRAPVRWGEARAALVLERRVFDVPLSKADPALLAYFERQADALAAAHAADEQQELSARVRRLLVDALPAGPPSAENVARRLGVSARSLRRRLGDEGTSFQALLESTRSELAQRHLRDPQLTVSEIAFLVGFSELSPFQRAFRRWTGMSPRDFRTRAREVT